MLLKNMKTQNPARNSSSSLKHAGAMSLRTKNQSAYGASVTANMTAKQLDLTGHDDSIVSTRTRAGMVRTLSHEGNLPHEPGSEEALHSEHVDRMGEAFVKESSAQVQQRALVDELHQEQDQRLQEIDAEISGSMRDLVAHVDSFVESSGETLSADFEELRNHMTARFQGLLPRLKKLEIRTQALLEAIKEESGKRKNETEIIAVPVKAQLTKLSLDFERERQIRDGQCKDLQQKLDQAVLMLDNTFDMEFEAREQSIAHTVFEAQQDVNQLSRWHEKSEKAIEGMRVQMTEEMDAERQHRIDGEDPIVAALAGFFQRFQMHITEQSKMGN
jgi:hypothetical protein